MITRREFVQAALAAGMLTAAGGLGNWSRLAARQGLSEEAILEFEPLGNVTLVHISDIHAQLKPVYFREPSVNIGVGEAAGRPPHITGAAFLEHYHLAAETPGAYALTYEDFVALARSYGRMGGLDRVATVLKSIRSAREGKTLFLDGGDTWQGSYTANRTKGADMIAAMNSLGPDAMTGHWEFTYGEERVRQAIEALPYPFLAGNIFEREWEEPAFPSTATFERGGVKIAVIGQAFPYTPIANPRWMIPDWSFGIRQKVVQSNVDAARRDGASLVVLLSHNGFDVDRKLASQVDGIDVILTGHTHDALPEPVKVGGTLLIASGSNGKFLSRLDLDVGPSGVKDFRYRLIPIFSDAISPDPETRQLVDQLRAPYAAELKRVVGRTDSLLYRRGSFNGTFDDLICQALLAQRDAEIALSPGFRWGPSLLPEQAITVEDIHAQTAITYPSAYRTEMTGAQLKEIFEDVADNLFNKDPYYQQGGDMVRVGGLGYAIDPSGAFGSRISDMTLLRTGEPIERAKKYVVAGWASVNPDVEGPPVWDVVEAHVADKKTLTVAPNEAIKVIAGH